MFSRKVILIIASAFGGIAITTLAIIIVFRPAVYAGRCNTDDELSADTLAPIDRQAIGFAKNFLSAAADAAYADFATEAKQTTSPVRFKALVAEIQKLAPFEDPRIEHTYVEREHAAGSAQTTMEECTVVAHGSIAKPEGRVFIAARPMSEQAHVIIGTTSGTNGYALVLWLVPEKSDWRILNVHFGIASVLGKSATDLWTAARNQEKQNHLFNAAVLYGAAINFAYRGPDLQLGILPAMQNEMAKLKVPPQLSGHPPFDWAMGGKLFRVAGIGPIADGTKFALLIKQEIPAIGTDANAEDQNRSLIDAFTKSFPEYSDAFDELIVEVIDASRRTYRTAVPAPIAVRGR